VSDHPRRVRSRAKVSLSRTRLCQSQVWPSRRFGLRLSVRVFHQRSEIIANYPDIGMIRPKALLDDRQSLAVQRLRLGPVDLGHQSGEVAEPQAARASRGDPAWISLPGPAWLLPERMETASRFRSGSHRAHRGERSSGYGKRRQNQGSHRTLRWRKGDSNRRSPMRENQLTRVSRLTATRVSPGRPTPAPADLWR
jgi:hypothetical protein